MPSLFIFFPDRWSEYLILCTLIQQIKNPRYIKFTWNVVLVLDIQDIIKKIHVIFLTDELQPLRTDENSSKIYNTYDQLRQQNRMDYERQRRMPSSQPAPQPEQPLQRPSSHHEPPRVYKTFLTVLLVKEFLCYVPVLLTWFKVHGVNT